MHAMSFLNCINNNIVITINFSFLNIEPSVVDQCRMC